MNQIHPSTFPIPSFSCAVAVTACLCLWTNEAHASGGSAFQWGSSATFGNGEIRTFASVLPWGKPLQIGVLFTGQMLSNLPTSLSDGNWDILDDSGNVVIPCCGHEVMLNFPNNVDSTAFQNFVLNWVPEGHEPVGVYDIPHFDIHFYTISNEARLQIEAPLESEMCSISEPFPQTAPVSCEIFEEASLPLPLDMQPPNHFSVGAVEPGIGNHLIDFTSPEFNGQTFTHSFAHGSFGGELTFYKPQVTRDYLLSAPWTCSDISQPSAQPVEGYYPTRYCIRYFGPFDFYTVTLERFRWFEATNGELGDPQ